MIYLFIFIYLLYLSIHYDILENRDYKWTNYKIAIALLILVAGLRWRVGSDTVIYAQEFVQSHDLFHLRWDDLASLGRMPLWVLLNAICKSIWNDFLLVQFIVAAFSISVTGYFIKKVCPSLCFFILLCYYIGGRYSSLHLELLRESMAVSFYLLGLLAINKEKYKLALLYSFLAMMFHIFAFASVLIFVVVNYLIPRNRLVRFSICVVALSLTLLNDDFVISFVENYMEFLSVNEEIELTILGYASSEDYGNIDKSIVNYSWLIIQFFAYIIMMYKCKNIYTNFILFRRELFNSGMLICIVLLCLKYSFLILYRIGLNYNYFFTCVVAVMFTKGILIEKIKKSQRAFVYFMLILFPLFFCCKFYFSKDYVYEFNYWYSRYYPYSSVLDKTFDYNREKLHNNRGVGYSEINDY